LREIKQSVAPTRQEEAKQRHKGSAAVIPIEKNASENKSIKPVADKKQKPGKKTKNKA